MARTKAAETKDWVGMWYTVARERGVNDQCTIAHVHTGNHTIQWNDFSHSEMDGVSWMVRKLRALGYQIPSMPQAKDIREPALWKRPYILWHSLRALSSHKIDWLYGDPDQPAGRARMAYLILTREETAKLSQIARDEGVNVNAILMSELSSLILPELASPGTRGYWLFPVNMRGGVRSSLEYCNQSSAIPVKADSDTSPEEIHAQIRVGLKKGVHWATWWLLHVGKLVGVNGMRYFSIQSAKKSHWLGTFSNMGIWPPEGSAPHALDAEETWLCAPPGTPNYPISVGCITWNGRFSMTLKLHPAICANPRTSWQILNTLHEKLFAPEKSPESAAIDPEIHSKSAPRSIEIQA